MYCVFSAVSFPVDFASSLSNSCVVPVCCPLTFLLLRLPSRVLLFLPWPTSPGTCTSFVVSSFAVHVPDTSYTSPAELPFSFPGAPLDVPFALCMYVFLRVSLLRVYSEYTLRSLCWCTLPLPFAWPAFFM